MLSKVGRSLGDSLKQLWASSQQSGSSAAAPGGGVGRQDAMQDAVPESEGNVDVS